MNKIIVLGKGLLGSEFEKQGFEVLGYPSKFCTKNNNEYEYNWNELSDYDVIINCIGRSDTRWCEDKDNYNSLYNSNVEIPNKLSRLCGPNKKFVHISTGCLYDQSDIKQKENSFLVAHCNYTVSKWCGELQCNTKKGDIILRPRLFFSDTKHKNNLLCKIPNFNALCDKQDSLTSTNIIVQATKELIRYNAHGVFNVACEGTMSMYEIGKLIGLGDLIGLDKRICTIEDIRKAQNLYLVNSIMDLSKIKQYYIPPKIEDEIIRCWNNLK